MPPLLRGAARSAATLWHADAAEQGASTPSEQGRGDLDPALPLARAGQRPRTRRRLKAAARAARKARGATGPYRRESLARDAEPGSSAEVPMQVSVGSGRKTSAAGAIGDQG